MTYLDKQFMEILKLERDRNARLKESEWADYADSDNAVFEEAFRKYTKLKRKESANLRAKDIVTLIRKGGEIG